MPICAPQYDWRDSGREDGAELLTSAGEARTCAGELCSGHADLRRKGLLLRRGTKIDTTVSAAPSSTRNADNARDPEMHHMTMVTGTTATDAQ